MTKKILILVVFGAVAFLSVSYVIAQGGKKVGPDTALASIANVDVNADTHAGVTTSMNGNTSATGGVAISSTSASKESRSVSGSGN